MTNVQPNSDSRAKVFIGIAIALIALPLLSRVVMLDLSRNSMMAAFFAKGVAGALVVMFCALLSARFGRVLRKTVGTFSLLIASLMLFGFLFGTIAWLFENMPWAGLFGGRTPVVFVGSFAAYAYIAWAFCFSSAVRAYEKIPNPAAEITSGLRPSVSDL
jgi:hypothetical protein